MSTRNEIVVEVLKPDCSFDTVATFRRIKEDFARELCGKSEQEILEAIRKRSRAFLSSLDGGHAVYPDCVAESSVPYEA
jgi:hypothetical protein